MNFVLYKRWDEVEGLRQEWNHLLAESASNTFFLTWEWCESWWQAYGNTRQPFVLAAWEDQTLVGVAPFYCERVRHAGRWWKLLRFIGDGSDDSDYLDCFALGGREEEFVASTLEYLNSHRDLWDYLELHGPADSSPFINALSKQLEGRNWDHNLEHVPCLTLKLPSQWNDYIQTLKPRFRTKVRSAMAFFEQQNSFSISECTKEEELEAWLPIFFDLHGKRWRSSGRTGVFLSNTKRAFYHRMSRAALQAGALSFHRLNWGERPLAFQYGFLYNHRFLLLQEAYDPDFESLRPGLALRSFRFREMIGSSIEEYDFLAGVAQHKLEWGASRKQSFKIGVPSSSIAAAVFLKAPAARRRLREAARSLTPEPVLRLRNRLLQDRHTQGDSNQTSRVSLKSVLAEVYASTPVHQLGKHVANRYELVRRDGSGRLSIEHRKAPACQILLYHRVNNDCDPFLPSLPVNEFRAQMEYVAKNFSVVTLDDIAAGRISPKDSKHAIAVTFDDGYRDNFIEAFPILKALAIPATIYLATGYIGTGRIPWYDEVCLAFKLTVRSTLNLDGEETPAGSLESREERVVLLEETLEWLRRMSDDLRKQAMAPLFRVLGVPAPLALPNFMLSWDEIRQMKAQGIKFGAHTVTHPVLSQVSGPELQKEIASSKKMVEQKLQTEVRHFAYPFGKAWHVNAEARATLEQLGFKTAVTTEHGLNRPGDDPLMLKRFTPWGPTRANFILQHDWYRFAKFAIPSSNAGSPVAPAATARRELGKAAL